MLSVSFPFFPAVMMIHFRRTAGLATLALALGGIVRAADAQSPAKLTELTTLWQQWATRCGV